MPTKTPKKELSPQDFLNDPQVLKSLQNLKDHKGEYFERLIVSDTLDDEGHQYVNLVQKGGGVLGIALVGYTYVLETAGIRFLRLAGTSAGAINTALMTVIGDKKTAKSEKILDSLCQLQFFSFVDGHPFARWLIKNFVTNKSFDKQLAGWLKGILISFAILVGLDILLTGLNAYWSWPADAAICSFILTGLNFLIILLLLIYGSYMFNRLKACGYGVNPGSTFYDWIKDRMEENDVTNVTTLNQKASTLPPLHIRQGRDSTASTLVGDVTFITSELVSENKIELPRMCNLFRLDIDELHPARFVRASMSIPIFFESHIIADIPVASVEIQNAWYNYFKIAPADIPETARFVDGGILSNFPINIFYNPRVVEPRLPAFGIDLDNSDPKAQTGNNALKWDLGSYAWRLFNTIRYYYDKDFMEKNFVFKKGVGSIKLFGFNWLNFLLTPKDKLEMFRRGAEAASQFLINFDWETYRAARIEMQTNINEKTTLHNL